MISNTATFDMVARLVSARLGWPYDTPSSGRLTTGQWNLLRAEISDALKWAWEAYWFEDLMHTCRVQLRADWDSTTTYAAGDEVYHPESDGYYIALRASTDEEPSSFTDPDWDTNTAYWAKVGETDSAERGGWATGLAYAAGDRVTWNDTTYQCHTAHTSAAGVYPNDATYWGEVPEFEYSVTYAGMDANGDTRPVIGRMRCVTASDPRLNRGSAEYEFEPTPTGVRFFDLSVTRPWVQYRVRCPQLVGDNWENGLYTPEASNLAVWGYESTLDSSGGTGTTAREIFAGAGLPTTTPTTTTALWIDTTTGNMYPWYDGEWHT